MRKHKGCGGEVMQFGVWSSMDSKYICNKCGVYCSEKDVEVVEDAEE